MALTLSQAESLRTGSSSSWAGLLFFSSPLVRRSQGRHCLTSWKPDHCGPSSVAGSAAGKVAVYVSAGPAAWDTGVSQYGLRVSVLGREVGSPGLPDLSWVLLSLGKPSAAQPA